MPFLEPRPVLTYSRDPIADPPDPVEEVELIHQAVERSRKGPRGVPCPAWLAGLCAHWLAEARQEDARTGHPPGPMPGDREGLAMVLVEEALTALDLAIRQAGRGGRADYELQALPQGNTVVLQLVPGKVIPVLLPAAQIQALLSIVNELVEKEDSIHWTPEAIRATALLTRALNTYTGTEGR